MWRLFPKRIASCRPRLDMHAGPPSRASVENGRLLLTSAFLSAGGNFRRTKRHELSGDVLIAAKNLVHNSDGEVERSP